jgi:hypothetical protein
LHFLEAVAVVVMVDILVVLFHLMAQQDPQVLVEW